MLQIAGRCQSPDRGESAPASLRLNSSRDVAATKAARERPTRVAGEGMPRPVTYLFAAPDAGLAAPATSSALRRATLGALGIPLLLRAETEPIVAAERRVLFTTGNAIAAFVVLLMAVGTIALSPFNPEPRPEGGHRRHLRVDEAGGGWGWRPPFHSTRPLAAEVHLGPVRRGR